jgi:hypothetical protein
MLRSLTSIIRIGAAIVLSQPTDLPEPSFYECRESLINSNAVSIQSIAKKHNLSEKTMHSTLSLALLAPDIVAALRQDVVISILQDTERAEQFFSTQEYALV